MFLVKLDAINSTNSYLKELSKAISTRNWTVVSTDFQSSGRGQRHTNWESVRGKNLIFSVLIKFENFKVKNQFYLNCAIALGIYHVLTNYKLPQLKVKWPNDIMSDNKKLGGILIENILRNDSIYQTVVGIGINVNQHEFPLQLVKAISMQQILKKKMDRDSLLIKIVESLKIQIELLEKEKFETLFENYLEVLFKKNIPSMFVNKNNQKFLGKIIGVTSDGKLKIEKENQVIQEFKFKEIKFI